MTARRVLVTTDAVGGVWVYSLELLAALNPEFDIHLAVLGPAPTAAQMDAARAAGAAVHVTGLPLDWTARLPDELTRASQKLAALAQNMDVDLVQLHTPALLGIAPWPAPVLAVLHSCVGTWWHAMRGGQPLPPDFAWRMAAVQAGLEEADAIISPTRALGEVARKIYGIRRDFLVIHNTRQPADVSRPPRTDGVLAAGRLWDEAKNIAFLDQAASLMAGINVRAAGPSTGPNGAGIALSAIQNLGSLTSSQMAFAMASARLFVSPARYEPFGLAVLEAAQMGLSLVLADTPSFRELWDGAAIFLSVENPADWAAALGTLHGDPAQCREWGARAKTRAANYSGEIFAGRMRETYRNLVAAPRRAAAA